MRAMRLSADCASCGDVAIAMRVVTVRGTAARCAERDGGACADVALDFVPDARPGDLVLVHAGVALAKLAAEGDGCDEVRR
jgi:hydrogenase expression/formation protein HypC